MGTDKVIRYVSIRSLMSRLYKNPLLEHISLEDVLQYLGEFMELYGFPTMYEDREVYIHIDNYRAQLPVDVIKINQVLDKSTKRCLTISTATFSDGNNFKYSDPQAYKIQGTIIVTSFKKGDIILSYKSFPLDDSGYPKIPQSYLFLLTLELYIKEQYYTLLYDQGKISFNVLSNVKTDYDWRSGQLVSQVTTPSMEEMEVLTNVWNRMIPDMLEHKQGFNNLGTKEHIKLV